MGQGTLMQILMSSFAMGRLLGGQGESTSLVCHNYGPPFRRKRRFVNC